MATDWHYREFEDGTMQWLPLPNDSQGWPPTILIERDLLTKREWFIVDRTVSQYDNYPPKIAGPFKTADAAKAAFIIRYA